MSTPRVARSCLLALAWFASLLALPPATAADWPAFGGPERDGISSARDVPLTWNADTNIAWKQSIPGSGWSSPCLVDGYLYLTTATGTAEADDVSLRVLCLRSNDGTVEWDVEAIRPPADRAQLMHSKNSLASPTLLVDRGRIYAHFGHMGTAALDLAGNVLWQQTDLTYNPIHGNGGSPELAGDVLVYNADGNDQQFVVALDPQTGRVAWQIPRSGTSVERKFSFSTPRVIELAGREQIISAGSGYVGAYDPADGREIWRVHYGDGFSVVPRPIWAHERLYVTSGFMRASLLAIDPAKASGDVTQSHVTWKHDQGVPTTPTPLVVNDHVFFVSDRGVATCLDAHTGEERWKERLGGGFSASPVFAQGSVYFTNEAGVTYVVRAAPTYELLAKNDLRERVLASPAVDDGAIYLRTEAHLWRIGAAP